MSDQVTKHPVPLKSVLSGRYEIVRRLGEGGMASVYLAKDRNLQVDVAIKFPARSLLHDNDFLDRFLLETRALVELRHPNIVKIIDVGQDAGMPFAVMDCLSGGTINDQRYLDKQGNYVPVLPVYFDKWLNRIAEALDFIHRKGYIHRDIKPENILFDDHGNPYLSDFGIAKVLNTASGKRDANLTQVGMVIGTPCYIAPEVNLGQSFDGRCDQYSLAILVYELLLGQRPFLGTTPGAVAVEQMNVDLNGRDQLKQQWGDDLDRVLLKALSNQPDSRFGSCVEFESALAEQLSKLMDRPIHQRVVSKCPKCQAAIAVQPEWVGRVASCNQCKERLVIEQTGMFTSPSALSAPSAAKSHAAKPDQLSEETKTNQATAVAAIASHGDSPSPDRPIHTPKPELARSLPRWVRTPHWIGLATVVVVGLSVFVVGRISSTSSVESASVESASEGTPVADSFIESDTTPDRQDDVPLITPPALERWELVQPKPQFIHKLSEWTFNLATNLPLTDQMSFAIAEEIPEGMELDRRKGVLAWTPGPTEKLGTRPLTVSLRVGDELVDQVELVLEIMPPDVGVLERVNLVDKRFVDRMNAIPVGTPQELFPIQLHGLKWLNPRMLVGYLRHKVGTIDVITGQYVERLSLPSLVRGVVVDPDRPAVYIGTGNAWDGKVNGHKKEFPATIVRVNTDTWQSETIFEEPRQTVEAFTLTSDGGFLVAKFIESRQAFKIRLSDLQITPMQISGSEFTSTNHPDYIYSAHELIDIHTGKTAHRLGARGNQKTIALRGQSRIALCEAPNKIRFVDVASNQMIREVELNLGWGTAWNKGVDPGTIWAATNDGKLHVIQDDASIDDLEYVLANRRPSCLLTVPSTRTVIYEQASMIRAFRVPELTASPAVARIAPAPLPVHEKAQPLSGSVDFRQWHSIETNTSIPEGFEFVTVDAVCKPKRLDLHQVIFSNFREASSSSFGWGIGIELHIDGRYGLRVAHAQEIFRLQAKQKAVQDETAYLTGIISRDGTVAFYVNGEFQDQVKIPAALNQGQGFRIGGMNNTRFDFRGEVSCVRLSTGVIPPEKSNQPYIVSTQDTLLLVRSFNTVEGLAIETSRAVRSFPMRKRKRTLR